MGKKLVVIFVAVLLIGGAVTVFLWKPWQATGDGGEITTGRGNSVGNIVNGATVAESNGWIYFIDPGYDELHIYKIEIGGEKKYD